MALFLVLVGAVGLAAGAVWSRASRPRVPRRPANMVDLNRYRKPKINLR